MQSYYDRIVHSGTGESPHLMLPAGLVEIAAGVIPGAASPCALEFTVEDPKLVQPDGTGVTWFTWTPGSVSVKTVQALLSIVTAVRLVSSGVNGGTLIISGRR